MQSTGPAIYSPGNWTEKLPLEELFPNKASIEVEIGCGKGHFLTTRAASHPQSNFLGIDKLLKRLRMVDKKIGRAGLNNVKLLHIEASYALEKLLPPSSVSILYVFFPDPWPKRRHHTRRLFSPDFMNSLYAKLVPEGLIYIATDHFEYSEWIKTLFSKDQRFKATLPFEPQKEERTELETLFMQKGMPIARLGFMKKPE